MFLSRGRCIGVLVVVGVPSGASIVRLYRTATVAETQAYLHSKQHSLQSVCDFVHPSNAALRLAITAGKLH